LSAGIVGLAFLMGAGGPAANAACPNEILRVGPSASLPDCRAYEIVTPTDSRGRRFGDLSSEPQLYDLFANELASPFQDSLVYTVQGSALREPGHGNGTLLGDVYQAVREPAGWQTLRHVTPSGDEAFTPYVGGISADHHYSFVFVPELFGGTNGSLGEEIDYLGDPEGNFELTGIGSLGSEPFAQGRFISPGGSHVIFSTGHETEESGWCGANQECRTSKKSVKQLEPNAPGGGTGVVYDRSADGPTHVISLLPGNATPATGENAIYLGASADGSSVAFKINGVLYVRVDNEETLEVATGSPNFGGLSADGKYLFYISGGDIHRLDTATKEDLGINSTSDGEMVNASADGSHLYFSSPSVLSGNETNENGEEAVPSAKGTGELSAASGTGTLTDESPVVSSVVASKGSFEEGMEINGFGIPEGATITALGAGTLTLSEVPTRSGATSLAAGSKVVSGVAMSEGDFRTGMEIGGEGIAPRTTITGVSAGTITLSKGATKSVSSALTATFPNLYSWSAAGTKYVATLDPADAVGVPSLTAWTSHVVSPIDGAGHGPGADPSRASPSGSVMVFESRAKLTSYDNAGHTEIYRYEAETGTVQCVSCNLSAATAESDARLGDYSTLRRTTTIHNVSSDGSRVFFETAEALDIADTDGINDIYEWQPPQGAGLPTVSLISSGKSTTYPQEPLSTPPRPNILLGVTPDGGDVFFLSQDTLVAGAPSGGASAIYDARIDGGFAPVPAPPLACPEGNACQGQPAPPPALPAVPSQTVFGPGNVKLHKRHHCSRRHQNRDGKRQSCGKKKSRSTR